MQDADNVEYIYLCFNDEETDSKRCRFASSPNGLFEELPASLYPHRKTKIATNVESEPDLNITHSKKLRFITCNWS